MPKKVIVFANPLTGDFPASGLKCLTLTHVGKFVVTVEIPEKISKAMERGDKTACEMHGAVMKDYLKFLKLAHDVQMKVDRVLIAEPDPNKRTKLVEGLTKLLEQLQDLCKEDARKSTRKVWDEYAKTKPEYNGEIVIDAGISGSPFTARANNLGRK